LNLLFLFLELYSRIRDAVNGTRLLSKTGLAPVLVELRISGD